jgi:hypothetical protein
MNKALEIAKSAVVQVGGGRGFIVSAGESRYVVTAAHCLPFERLATPHLANSVSQLTFPKIMGALGAKKRTIWGELCAVNLCDDFAVFSEPDDQELSDQCELYRAFTGQAMTVGQSPPPPRREWSLDNPPLPGIENETPAWVLSLDGKWHRCMVQNTGRFLLATQGGGLIKSGMSGSPIVNDDGAAIGVVSTSDASGRESTNPSLMDCLPQWLLRKLDI